MSAFGEDAANGGRKQDRKSNQDDDDDEGGKFPGEPSHNGALAGPPALRRLRA